MRTQTPMPTWSKAAVLMLSCAGACGRPVIGDDGGADAHVDDPDDAEDDHDAGPAGEDDSPACEGPYCSDASNCGAPGVRCERLVEGDSGNCHDGRCARVLGCASEIYDPPPGFTCDDLCGVIEEDSACLEHGCAGYTAFIWPQVEGCSYIPPDELKPFDLTCDDAIDFSSVSDGSAVRCCCIGA